MSITCEFVKLELIDDKLKCGDIYIRTNGVFSLTCGFCELLEFFTLDSYSDHFNCHMKKEKERTGDIRLDQPTSRDTSLGNILRDDKTFAYQEDPFLNDDFIPVSQLSDKPLDIKDENIISDSEGGNNPVKHSPAARDPEVFYKEPYACEHCDKRFASEKTRDGHEKNHIGGPKPITKLLIRPCRCKEPKCPKHRRRAPRKKQQVKCKHCHEEFLHLVDLRKHCWRAHNIGTKCRFCDRQFYDRGNLNVHERTHTGELPYQCKYCSRAFNTSTTLKNHIMVHEDNRPLLCTLCGKRFVNNQKLNRHTKEYHTVDFIFSCTLCDETFETRQSFERHRRSIHNNHKNIVLTCDICTRQFNTRKYLVQHMKIHTGEKLYKCRYCELTFAQAAGKRGHERSKHEDI